MKRFFPILFGLILIAGLYFLIKGGREREPGRVSPGLATGENLSNPKHAGPLPPVFLVLLIFVVCHKIPGAAADFFLVFIPPSWLLTYRSHTVKTADSIVFICPVLWANT